MTPTRVALGVGGAGFAAAGSVAAWAMGYEVRSFRLRRFTCAVLPPGSPSIRLLHVSDLHLMPGQRRKASWIADLARFKPDVVVSTGDHWSSENSLDLLAQALAPFLDLPGAMVFGSNDYWAPAFKNPLRYVLPDDGRRVANRRLPVDRLVERLTQGAWHDLTNATTQLTVRGVRIGLGGIDDSHIGLDRYDEIAGARPESDVAIGVMHSPEPANLRRFADDGYALILAGHTHGGQVCVPGRGALATNCGLERPYVKGLHRRRGALVHVSAGLGTSPYAPYRLACPPEASLLTLVGRDEPGSPAPVAEPAP